MVTSHSACLINCNEVSFNGALQVLHKLSVPESDAENVQMR